MSIVAPAQLSLQAAHAGVEEEQRIAYHPHPHTSVPHVDPELNYAYDYQGTTDTPVSKAQVSEVHPNKFQLQPMEIDVTKPPTDEEEKERKTLRTATWMSCFFLIVTDILGPTSAPYAFSKLGYGPGFVVYFMLGLIALYTGILLWQMYLKLDEPNRRVLQYGDLVLRIFGPNYRHVCNVLQSIQLLFNVAVIVLGNAQGLAQISEGKVCFVVLSLIWTIAGMLIGQIRALSNLRGISTFAIVLNFAVIFITLGAVSESGPNYSAALNQNAVVAGPVVASATVEGVPWTTQLVAVMQAVYAYGGAMIFVEIISEMKNPKEFAKALCCAEAVIIFAYIMFGMVVYSKQGQFTINPANQGISPYDWQTASNVLNLVSALIAAGLYGNIGLKVIYQSVVIELFNGPELVSTKGRVLWTGLVLAYWGCAFIICSAIPMLSNISGLVAAICILQFTYTFPFAMQLGLDWQISEAIWWRKCLSPKNIFHFVMTIASLACAGLGAYSSIQGIIDANKDGSTSFTCASPI